MKSFRQLQTLSEGFVSYAFQLLSDSTPVVHFVQIGSHDGVSSDPLYPFIRARGWVGVRVEPMPENYAKLVTNCSNLPGVVPMQVLCSRDTSKRPFYSLRPGRDNLHTYLSSFDRETIIAHASLVPDIENRIVENYIETLTVDQIMKRANLPGIDLLSVDAEGHDDDCIYSTDFEKHRPRLIYFEHKHIREGRLRSLDEFLTLRGYVGIRLHTDTLYFFEQKMNRRYLEKLSSAANLLFGY